MAAPINIRPTIPADRNYLLSTMRQALLKTSAYCEGLHPEVLTNLLESILTIYTTAIATPVDDSSMILGFIVYAPGSVGFIYVRKHLRQHKLGTRLLEHAGISKGEIIAPLMVTKIEITPGVWSAFPKLAAAHGYTIRFRPYLPLQLQANAMLPKLEVPPLDETNT